MQMTNGTWNMLLIATHPEHQKKGMASALIQQLEAILTAKQQRILLVETSGLPSFQSQRAFYGNRGELFPAPVPLVF